MVTQLPAASPHPPAQLSTRLLGCWPVKGTTGAKQARTAAVAGLVDMCVEQSVLPNGDPTISTFADRMEVLLSAHELGVKLTDLLCLAEHIGFKRDGMFVAAVVDVRPFGLSDRELERRRTA